MRTGWLTINGCRYYFQPGGSMVTGWQKIGPYWYYFGSGGAMTTGWQSINGKWYYMSSSGVMQTGKCELGGKEYYFNSTGAWINEDDIMQRVKNVFMKKYSHLGIDLHYPYPGGPISGDTLILCVSRTWAINDPDSGTKWTIAYVNTVTGYVICDYETWQEVFPKVSRTFYIW